MSWDVGSDAVVSVVAIAAPSLYSQGVSWKPFGDQCLFEVKMKATCGSLTHSMAVSVGFLATDVAGRGLRPITTQPDLSGAVHSKWPSLRGVISHNSSGCRENFSVRADVRVEGLLGHSYLDRTRRTWLQHP